MLRKNFILSYAALVLSVSLSQCENLLSSSNALSFGNASLGTIEWNMSERGTLFERQTRRCENPAWVPCSNIPNKCCPPGDNCRLDLGKCCPPEAETCGGRGCWEPGTVCCAAGNTCQPGYPCCLNSCCQQGTICCPQAVNCCRPGDICCPGACCPQGSECGSLYGLCRSKISTTSPKTTTTSSSTTSRAPVPPTTTSPQPTPQKPKEPKTTTSPDVTTTSAQSSSSASTTSNTCQTPNPSPTGEALQALPFVEFFYYPGYDLLNDIVLSVCLGIRSRKGGGNFDILTKGEGSSHKCYRQRRYKGNCAGCCTGVYKDDGPFQTDLNGNPQITSCDEYPFASSAEGGEGAHRSCVVDFQNSYQGTELKWQYKLRGIRLGDSYGVRVVGLDCDTVKESDLQGCGGVRGEKRQINENVMKQGTSNFTIPARNGTTDSNTFIIPLGDLRSGKYNSLVKLLSGQVQDLSIISNSGEDLVTTLSLEQLATQGQQLDFDLEEGEYGVGIVASTKDMNVNMSYVFSAEDGTVTTTILSSATGTGASPTSSKPSAAAYGKEVRVWLLLTVLFMGLVVI